MQPLHDQVPIDRENRLFIQHTENARKNFHNKLEEDSCFSPRLKAFARTCDEAYSEATGRIKNAFVQLNTKEQRRVIAYASQSVHHEIGNLKARFLVAIGAALAIGGGVGYGIHELQDRQPKPAPDPVVSPSPQAKQIPAMYTVSEESSPRVSF